MGKRLENVHRIYPKGIAGGNEREAVIRYTGHWQPFTSRIQRMAVFTGRGAAMQVFGERPQRAGSSKSWH